MRLTGSLLLTILAVLLFLIPVVLVLADDEPVEAELLIIFGFGGLAAFAAAHFPGLS